VLVWPTEPNLHFTGMVWSRLSTQNLISNRFVILEKYIGIYTEIETGSKIFVLVLYADLKTIAPIWSLAILTPRCLSYSQSTTNNMQRCSNLFISVRRSSCFRRGFRPSSGAQNSTYSVRYLSDRYCFLLLTATSSIVLTNTWRCMCSFELLMMDGKTVWNM